MGINIKAIKKGIAKAIKISPTGISLMRENRVNDGFEGYYVDRFNPYIEVATIDIFLNDLDSSKNKSEYTEGGRRDDISGVSAIILYDESFTVLQGDFFTLNNKKYIVKYPTNVYNAYWNVDLEVSTDGR